MLKVEYMANEQSRHIELRLKGHAHAGEVGKDIVCSAASILAYSASGCAEMLYGDGCLYEPPLIRMEEGDSVVSVNAKDDESYRKARLAFTAVEIGFYYLAAASPDHVRYTHR